MLEKSWLYIKSLFLDDVIGKIEMECTLVYFWDNYEPDLLESLSEFFLVGESCNIWDN